MAVDEEGFPLRNVLCTQMSCSCGKVTGDEEFWAVARRRSRSSRGGTEERECAGENEV
jgi:hypothetical protein